MHLGVTVASKTSMHNIKITKQSWMTLFEMFGHLAYDHSVEKTPSLRYCVKLTEAVISPQKSNRGD